MTVSRQVWLCCELLQQRAPVLSRHSLTKGARLGYGIRRQAGRLAHVLICRLPGRRAHVVCHRGDGSEQARRSHKLVRAHTSLSRLSPGPAFPLACKSFPPTHTFSTALPSASLLYPCGGGVSTIDLAFALLLPCFCLAFAFLLPCFCLAFALLLPCFCLAFALLSPCFCLAFALLSPCFRLACLGVLGVVRLT